MAFELLCDVTSTMKISMGICARNNCLFNIDFTRTISLGCVSYHLENWITIMIELTLYISGDFISRQTYQKYTWFSFVGWTYSNDACTFPSIFKKMITIRNNYISVFTNNTICQMYPCKNNINAFNWMFDTTSLIFLLSNCFLFCSTQWDLTVNRQ